MTQAKRIDNDEALRLATGQNFNANHVLVIGDKRHRAEKRDGYCAFWYGSQPQDWVSAAQLEPMLKLGVAHVEIETPSPFDDEAFEGWFSSVTGGKEEYKSLKSATITQSGTITVDTFAVPIDQIPEAARHINALLALGEK